MSASGWPPLPPEEKLRCHLEAAHLREFVAIEPDSCEYFLGKTLIEAIQASRAAHADQLSFGLRVGHTSAVHFGVLNS
jgi:hypothetical protein